MRQAARGQSFASRRVGYDWKCQGSERLRTAWPRLAVGELRLAKVCEGKAKQHTAKRRESETK